MSVFVPIIGYYVLYSEHISNIFVLDEDIFPDRYRYAGLLSPILNLPRPHILYFGLLFIALGSILYFIFCPSLVKENESAEHYFRLNEHSSSIYDIDIVVRRINSSGGLLIPYYKSWADRIEKYYGCILDINSLGLHPIYPQKERPKRLFNIYNELRESSETFGVDVNQQIRLAMAAVMDLHYSIENRSRKPARLLCTVFYGFGFSLVAVASFQVALQILISML